MKAGWHRSGLQIGLNATAERIHPTGGNPLGDTDARTQETKLFTEWMPWNYRQTLAHGRKSAAMVG